MLCAEILSSINILKLSKVHTIKNIMFFMPYACIIFLEQICTYKTMFKVYNGYLHGIIAWRKTVFGSTLVLESKCVPSEYSSSLRFYLECMIADFCWHFKGSSIPFSHLVCLLRIPKKQNKWKEGQDSGQEHLLLLQRNSLPSTQVERYNCPWFQFQSNWYCPETPRDILHTHKINKINNFHMNRKMYLYEESAFPVTPFLTTQSFDLLISFGSCVSKGPTT